MNGSAKNSSSSASGYFWSDCDPYDDKVGGPSAGLIILFITYALECLLGAPSNLWLISHILRTMSKVSGILPADFFPFHLALTHLSFYLVLPSFLINHFLLESSSLLAMTSVFTSMMLAMKPLLLCLVCVERYMAVVRPLDYLRYKARRYRWGCLGVSWCIYILIASSTFLKRSSIAVCIVFLPVLVTDTFCSLSILIALKKPPPGDREVAERDEKGVEQRKIKKQVVSLEKEKQEQGSAKEENVKQVGRSRPRGKGDMNSMKRKAFITIAIIQAVLTLNYVPFIICLPLEGQVPPRTLKCQYTAMALAAAASCSYLQPLLYLYRLGKLPFMKSPNT